jgi:response regulator of citrate/malate metabolism
MKVWPDYDNNGDLPGGIHQATLAEVVEHFGQSNLQRQRVAQRLARIYDLAQSTGQVARFIIYGSIAKLWR